MATYRADRRLYVTADRSQVVEEGDPRGAWLLVGLDAQIGAGDVARYGLRPDSYGRVVYDGCPLLKEAPIPENKMTAPAENKAAEPEEEDEEDEVEEWPLKTPPDEYLARHPDGPKAELARRILEAEDDGAAGES